MKQEYTIALDAITDGLASFTVTRTVADNDPVAWVHVDCSVPQDFDERPVVWGQASSLTGTVSLPVEGSCRAVVTHSPWRPKQNDVAIEFEA
jgi:hypothetical protein